MGAKPVTMPEIDEIVEALRRISKKHLKRDDLICGYAMYDKRRPKGWPVAETILKYKGYTPGTVGWCQFVADVIGLDVVSAHMARRNTAATIPPLDDIIEEIERISEEVLGDEWTIGKTAWDAHKPKDWPTCNVVLKHFGYTANADGWNQFVDEHIGTPVRPVHLAISVSNEARTAKQWRKRLAHVPDYTAQPDEVYQAMQGDGFAVCEETYRQTGRLMLR